MSSLIDASEGWAEPVVLDDIAPTATAVVRHEGVTLNDLSGLFDTAFPRVAAAAFAAGNPPIGPATALYEGDPATTFSIEIGFPVSTPFGDADGVLGSALPGGRVAVLTHLGDYETLSSAWKQLMEFLDDRGLHPGPQYGEVYVTEPGPDVDPATLRTDIFVVLG